MDVMTANSIQTGCSSSLIGYSSRVPPTDDNLTVRSKRRLRAGIVGGGRGAFIGSVHRIAAELDGQAQIVAGAMSKDPKIARASAADWFLERAYTSRYLIDSHNPSSAFHRALHVSYPSAAEAAQARSGGYDPGGDIMVHGIHNGLGWIGRAHRFIDWTVGCIAVTDSEIEELYRIVPDGTPMEWRP
jgi:hypothetical protein